MTGRQVRAGAARARFDLGRRSRAARPERARGRRWVPRATGDPAGSERGWTGARGLRRAGLGGPPGLTRCSPLPSPVSPQRGGPPARHTMPAQAALLLALLAALPAGHRAAEPAEGGGGRAAVGPTAALLPKAPPAELARGSFWDYLSQLTSDKDSHDHGQGKLGRDST